MSEFKRYRRLPVDVEARPNPGDPISGERMQVRLEPGTFDYPKTVDFKREHRPICDACKGTGVQYVANFATVLTNAPCRQIQCQKCKGEKVLEWPKEESK